MAAVPSSSSTVLQHYINPQNQMRQEGEAKAFNGEAEEAVVTLLIRHLPEAIPLDTLSRLFSHYGASSVRPCSAPKCVDSFFLLFLLCFNPITIPSFSIALIFSFCLSAD
jgi:U11/U12 small nuclear ribonucleoprotein SNRNP65